MEALGVLRKLFDEKKVEVLSLFFSRPKEDFYLREVSRETGVSPATTYRIINELVDLKLLQLKKLKKTKLYALAHEPVVEKLRPLFEEKEDPMGDFVDEVSSLAGVHMIILRERRSDKKSNVLVVGKDLDTKAINSAAEKVNDAHGTNIVILTLTDDQYSQMSSMGLFPGKKKILWKK